MSIQSEITRISSAKSDIADAIEQKGVTVPANTKLDGYAALVLQIDTEADLQNKTVTPTESVQTITADAGFDGLGTVSVDAIDSEYVGSEVSRRGPATYVPGAANMTIPARTYLTGEQLIQGDADLRPENIVEGVNIFGIVGTAEQPTAMTAAEILTAVQAGWV